MKFLSLAGLLIGLILLTGCPKQSSPGSNTTPLSDQMKTVWKSKLSDNSYQIMVEKGTEPPYHNEYWDNHKKGVYVSAASGEPLFSSDTKFDSHTGWPSFWKPISDERIAIVADSSFGVIRQEVVEKKTGLHLGHVFDDGPQPTGLRYCMNSGALKFIADTAVMKTGK